ncbi:MAG: hypothetical protein K0B09_02300, partial [Bacteroidales bacterium]|nr:hypothetical protein [Bacteroidales bacterium]
MNPQPFQDFFRDKKIAILGFAREGQSTYRAIRKVLPDFPLVVCDRQVPGKEVFPDREKDHQTKWCFGENYLDGIQGADIIIKSPGIPFRVIESETLRERVVSQTGLFL